MKQLGPCKATFILWYNDTHFNVSAFSNILRVQGLGNASVIDKGLHIIEDWTNLLRKYIIIDKNAIWWNITGIARYQEAQRMKRPLMIPFITYNVTTYKKPKNQNISD